MDNKTNFINNYTAIMRTLKNASNCNYYRKSWGQNSINISEINTYEDFRKIPIITKKTYMNNILDFINDDCYAKGFEKEIYHSLDGNIEKISEYLAQFDLKINFTSGTTGKPMNVIINKYDLMNAYINLNIYRNKCVNNILSEKFVWIWLHNNNYIKYRNIGERIIEKKSGWQFLISDFSGNELMKVHEFINEKNIKWMICSPSFLYYYANFLLDHGLREDSLQYIECQSEKLLPWQKKRIAEVTSAKIHNIYSSNEIHFIGADNEEGIFYQLNRNSFIEFVNIENESRAIITNIAATKMPLIRYDLGDLGSWLKDEKIEKGNKTAFFKLESYRSTDKIVLRDGRVFEFYIISQSITMLIEMLNLNIEQYQVIQKTYECFEYDLQIENEILLGKNKEITCFLQNFLNRSLELSDISVEVKIYNGPFVNKNCKYKYFISWIMKK